MKHKFLSILMAALIAVAPAFAQQARNGQDEEKEAAEPKTGVRFVNCSPGNVQIPDPLFCKAGKSYKQIRISSRVPSRRVKAYGGVIKFYDKDPAPSTEAGSKGNKGNKGAKAAKDPEIQPVMTFTDIPEGKVLGILRPSNLTNPPYDKAMNPLFIKEETFPKSGVHIINLTKTPLKMKVSKDPNFADVTDKDAVTIAPYKGGKAVDGNSWSAKGEDGTTLSFILSAEDGKKKIRIKASRFTISSRQAQINIVVDDPQRPGRFTLQSIQLTDKNDAKGQE